MGVGDSDPSISNDSSEKRPVLLTGIRMERTAPKLVPYCTMMSVLKT